MAWRKRRCRGVRADQCPGGLQVGIAAARAVVLPAERTVSALRSTRVERTPSGVLACAHLAAIANHEIKMRLHFLHTAHPQLSNGYALSHKVCIPKYSCTGRVVLQCAPYLP